MGKNALRLITILGMICILGIATVQVYWFQKAFDIQEKQFTHRATIALNRVANYLLEQTMDSTARLESIRQLTTNYFTVEFNNPINPELLEESLFNEFHNQEIDLNFHYGIFECYSDSFIYGDYVDMKDHREVSRVNYRPSSDENFYFGVSFPQKRSFIASQLRIWLIFTGLLLLVILFFGYALFIIFRQKRLSAIKTDFINNMTHELKTPLATISASSEVLMKGSSRSTEKVNTYAGIIHEESQRLRRQIESVLKISVLDSGKLILNRKPVDLQQVLKGVIRIYDPIITAGAGNLETSLEEGTLVAMGDHGHLENVFHNLLENAVKYSGSSLMVRITSRRSGGYAMVMVEDNGAGIPKAYQHRIFEKFFRVPTGDVHNAKGFGLGLYYVHRIIKAHRGSVSVESQEGAGSIFTIKLPLYRGG